MTITKYKGIYTNNTLSSEISNSSIFNIYTVPVGKVAKVIFKASEGFSVSSAYSSSYFDENSYSYTAGTKIGAKVTTSSNGILAGFIAKLKVGNTKLLESIRLQSSYRDNSASGTMYLADGLRKPDSLLLLSSLSAVGTSSSAGMAPSISTIELERNYNLYKNDSSYARPSPYSVNHKDLANGVILTEGESVELFLESISASSPLSNIDDSKSELKFQYDFTVIEEDI